MIFWNLECAAYAPLTIRPLKRRQWSFCGFAEGKEARAECR
jgi:hypothetical protein